MNVKKIVVDKKDGCVACPFCVRVNDYMIDYYECRATSKKVFDCTGMKYREYIDRFEEIGTPEWCPLVVEEVCEWRLAERDGGFGSQWYGIYNAECEPTYYVYDDYKEDFKFCPSCGKRIVYKESE